MIQKTLRVLWCHGYSNTSEPPPIHKQRCPTKTPTTGISLRYKYQRASLLLVAYVKATGWRYNFFPLASRIKAEDMFCHSSPCCNDAGFLQKNNSLDEKSRMMGAFKESTKNQMSCDNSERFTRADTDFSNLFARGNDKPHSESCFHTLLYARICQKVLNFWIWCFLASKSLER